MRAAACQPTCRSAMAFGRTAHSGRRCGRRCQFTVKDGSVVGCAAGHAEDGDEERQRYQCRPHPFRVSHRDDSAEDRVCRCHNCVLLSGVDFLFVVVANVAFASSLHCLLRQGTENPSVVARRKASARSFQAARVRKCSFEAHVRPPGRGSWCRTDSRRTSGNRDIRLFSINGKHVTLSIRLSAARPM